MERVIERGCGLDVHEKTVTACVRVPGANGAREQHVRTFGTTTLDLLALRDWLEASGVTHVAVPRQVPGGHPRARRAMSENGRHFVYVPCTFRARVYQFRQRVSPEVGGGVAPSHRSTVGARSRMSPSSRSAARPAGE